MTADDASEIWTELGHVHWSTGFTTHIGLKHKLWKMKMKDGQRMASWISDVKGVVFHLQQIRVLVPDEDIILTLTNRLPPSYEHLVLTLDSTPSNPFNLDYIIGCLQTKETRQHIKFGNPDTTATTDKALAVSHSCPK